MHDLWPADFEGHPWAAIKANRDLFDARAARAQELLYGDLEDDPGALSTYQRHRNVEWLNAQWHHHVIAPHCAEHRPDLLPRMSKISRAMYYCRRDGVFGVAGGDSLVVAWESKCGLGKLCPDEARAESLRLEERYSNLIAAHGKRGRVYKCWLTLPNYPQGRLQEGMRHIFKRFRDRFVRSKKFGIEGALVILEAPLSKNRDWNIHLNVVLLTRGWLSYKDVRAAWGANVEIKQHSDFSAKGVHNLFAEMVKYSVRAIPEKSMDGKHRDEAPAMLTWEPAEYIEWFEAHHPFRRTRAYGSLHGAPAPPERKLPENIQWLGRIQHNGSRYVVTWRGHNLGELAGHLMAAGHADLDLIRGDKSTKKTTPIGVRGPPW